MGGPFDHLLHGSCLV